MSAAILSEGVGTEEEVSGAVVLASLLELSCDSVEPEVASASLSVMFAVNRQEEHFRSRQTF